MRVFFKGFIEICGKSAGSFLKHSPQARQLYEKCKRFGQIPNGYQGVIPAMLLSIDILFEFITMFFCFAMYTVFGLLVAGFIAVLVLNKLLSFPPTDGVEIAAGISILVNLYGIWQGFNHPV